MDEQKPYVISKETRAKLIHAPWGRRDAIREKKRREKREALIERFRKTGKV